MSKREQVGKYVYKQITMLTAEKDYSSGKARLANLRRGAGKVPGELPELWGAFLNNIPDELLGKNGTPSRAEWAIYLALTLFALHQQGNSESVNAENISLGKAAAGLMEKPNDDDERERVMRRLGPVVTANDMPELSHHLRCLIQLMGSKGVKLDYCKLAEDLYDYQFDETRKEVRLRWGQDFYYDKKDEKERNDHEHFC